MRNPRTATRTADLWQQRANAGHGTRHGSERQLCRVPCPECGTCEQLKAPTDLEIMEALKAENEEMFAKLMAAEGENADMRMEKAADELTILKLKARLYDVLLGDQEENRQ